MSSHMHAVEPPIEKIRQSYAHNRAASFFLVCEHHSIHCTHISTHRGVLKKLIIFKLVKTALREKTTSQQKQHLC